MPVAERSRDIHFMEDSMYVVGKNSGTLSIDGYEFGFIAEPKGNDRIDVMIFYEIEEDKIKYPWNEFIKTWDNDELNLEHLEFWDNFFKWGRKIYGPDKINTSDAEYLEEVEKELNEKIKIVAAAREMNQYLNELHEYVLNMISGKKALLLPAAKESV